MKVTIKGTNFTAPATVTVQDSNITVSNVVVVSSTVVTATLHIGSNTSRGAHNTTVTSRAGASNVLPYTVR
jgi:hypothetical protein